MKKKLLLSVGSLAVGAAVVAGATFADFSSSQTVSNNTFTAGTLTMELQNGGPGATLGWQSPSNWAPGQEFTSTINFKNTGNVDAHHIYLGLHDLTHTGGPINANANLLDQITITDLHQRFGNDVEGNIASLIAPMVGNGDNVLTLKEFASTDWYTGGPVVLAGNSAASDYALSISFKFNNEAGNDYQGTIGGFKFWANATQNSPTDGFKELPKN